jgi:hypothetical protein
LRTPAAQLPDDPPQLGDEWSTAVRWASGTSVVSVAIRSVIAIVRSRVEPPAPYVTETKSGRSGSSWRIAVHSWRSPSSVLAGKNSKENSRAPVEHVLDRRAGHLRGYPEMVRRRLRRTVTHEH